MTSMKLAVAACISATLANANLRLPSPTTFLQEKPDPRLASSVQEFFTLTVGDDGTTMSTQSGDIKQLGGNRVQIIDDTFVSDYINVGFWDYDEELERPKDAPKDGSSTKDESLKLYFLMAESRGDPDTDPLVIWLNGGPGCSSMLGLFTENGPYNFKFDAEHVKDPFVLEKNDFSWNSEANVMYVD